MHSIQPPKFVSNLSRISVHAASGVTKKHLLVRLNTRNVPHHLRHSQTQLEYSTARHKISRPTGNPTAKIIVINLVKHLASFFTSTCCANRIVASGTEIDTVHSR
jgi:hypothetical protein